MGLRMCTHRAPKEGDPLEVDTMHCTQLLDATKAALPFSLTGAQERVIAEVVADVAKPEPMVRLLQVRGPAEAQLQLRLFLLG